MAQAPNEAQHSPSHPLKYKTWVLKVFIHCEACKKKVKRILHNIEGVYTIDIDSKLHKVIVTGNIDDSLTLIKHLQKSGKHAEPYPNNPNPNPNPNPISKPTKPTKKDETKHTNNVTNSIESNPANVSNSKTQDSGDNAEESPTGIDQVAVKDDEKIKIQEKGSPENEDSPAPEMQGNEITGGGSGSGGKKKKKKGQNGNNNLSKNENSGPADKPAKIESQPSNVVPNSGSHISDQVWQGPPGYRAPAATSAYVVRYNTAFPSHNTTSYLEQEPLGYYRNVGFEVDVEIWQPLDSGVDQRGPSDSFAVFSEENPNACSIM